MYRDLVNVKTKNKVSRSMAVIPLCRLWPTRPRTGCCEVIDILSDWNLAGKSVYTALNANNGHALACNPRQRVESRSHQQCLEYQHYVAENVKLRK
jgi:hypothetical protein